MTITGRGVIDGNRVFDPNGEERMRGPHTIIIGKCKNVTIRDIDIVDSANYAIMIEWSDEVQVRDVRVTGGWDGADRIYITGQPVAQDTFGVEMLVQMAW